MKTYPETLHHLNSVPVTMKQYHIFRYFIIVLSTILVIVYVLWFYLNVNSGYVTKPLQQYNYIIVGGGTAGCVLAAKLSENDKHSVLLIEAGDDFNFISNIPLLATTLQGTKYDWAFKTVPQKNSSFGLHNNVQLLPRGKGIGGSGYINYMIHGQIEPVDFSVWDDMEFNDWNYDRIQSNIKRFTEESIGMGERCSADKYTEEDYCPLKKVPPKIYLREQQTELSHPFEQSALELRHLNLKYHQLKSTIREGKRWTSYHGYLKPALGKTNLHILTNTHVSKIIFNDKQAIGVEILSGDNTKQIVFSQNEVVLSAGAFHTPQILLLSGIGASEELGKLRIPVVMNLPGVGQNMHDHLNMPLYVSVEKSISFTIDKALTLGELLKYFVYGAGYFGQTPMAGVVKGPSDTAMLLFGMGSTDEQILKDVSNYKTETFRSLFPLYRNSSQEGFVFLATCLRPTSRGTVKLSNTNPKSLPEVDPKYLSTNHDRDCMLNGMKLIMEIANTTAFRDIGTKIHWPKLDNCAHLEHNPANDDYLECILRTSALTGHHPAGTCKMGLIDDEDSVVDNSLRVKGVSGLRIMDASVLPNPIGTFPNSVLISMAENAAKIIIEQNM